MFDHSSVLHDLCRSIRGSLNVLDLRMSQIVLNVKNLCMLESIFVQLLFVCCWIFDGSSFGSLNAHRTGSLSNMESFFKKYIIRIIQNFFKLTKATFYNLRSKRVSDQSDRKTKVSLFLEVCQFLRAYGLFVVGGFQPPTPPESLYVRSLICCMIYVVRSLFFCSVASVLLHH